MTCLEFSHLLICEEIVCEQVEGLLRDETWDLDGNWSGSSWWCLSSLGCFFWNETWQALSFFPFDPCQELVLLPLELIVV